MFRKAFIVGIVIFILFLPFFLVILRNPQVQEMFPSFLRGEQRTVTSTHFDTSSSVSGYTVRLVDTKYLDYAATKLGIFSQNGIVDPRIYRGFPDIKNRYTVSKIQYSLVPMVDPAVVMISGPKSFVGRGNFRVQGDTLIVEVSLDLENLINSLVPTQYPLEEAFVRTAMETLYYAHGLVSMSDTRTLVIGLDKIKEDIKNYLYSGIFPWPIRIEKQ